MDFYREKFKEKVLLKEELQKELAIEEKKKEAFIEKTTTEFQTKTLELQTELDFTSKKLNFEIDNLKEREQNFEHIFLKENGIKNEIQLLKKQLDDQENLKYSVLGSYLKE